MVKKLGSIKSINSNEAYNNVLQWFFSYPVSEFSLNELSSKLKISKTTARKIVNQMIKEKFLTRKIYGKVWIIKCNPQSVYNSTIKIAYNISIVYNAYINGIRDDIFDVIKNPDTIILFGSYRKGDDTENSDIDIAIEVADQNKTGIIELGVISELGYRKNVRINLHVFSRKNVDINLFANIANGFVLEGFLEVNP